MSQLKWKEGETIETDRPADLEIGVLKVKVRRNITRTTRTTDDGKVKVWKYQYCDMTPTQYEKYKEELATLDAPFAQMIKDNNTMQLEAIAEVYEMQLANEESQLVIMEGLAEIYEAQGATE